MEYIIAPLSWLFRWALEFLQTVLGNYGLAIVLLSALVSAILLPLQLWADKLQQKDFNEKDAMRWALDSIANLKSAPKRFYYTNYIYRKYQYHPIKSMRGLVGLLVQLPFFLAAYFALSSFENFAGQGFLFIQDLAAPDQLWRGYNYFARDYDAGKSALGRFLFTTKKQFGAFCHSFTIAVATVIFAIVIPKKCCFVTVLDWQ